MKKTKILVIEDEETLCEALKFNLEIEGYEVAIAYSAEEALNKGVEGFDLLLLDIMMGSMSGFKLAQILKSKEATARIPIIFCTAKSAEDDMVAGLNLGADDYITKPYTIRNVIARVKSVLRRTSSTKEKEELIFKGLKIDLKSKRCYIDGREIPLTKKELEILILLLKNPGRVFSREQIMKEVWEPSVIVGERAIDVNLTRLRQKIEIYGKNIITRSGYGYAFED